MPSVGGSIEEISFRGRVFAVAADADATVKLGGDENEVQSNGDGSARLVKTVVAWSMTGVELDVNHERGDQTFLQELADGAEFVDVTITLASGTVLQGSGTIFDALEFSTQKSTVGISASGPGKLTRQ